MRSSTEPTEWRSSRTSCQERQRGQRNGSGSPEARADSHHQRPPVPSTVTTRMTEERAWGAGRLPESFQTDHAHCQVSHYCLILEFCHLPTEGMHSCSGQEETGKPCQSFVRASHGSLEAQSQCGGDISLNHCTNSPRKKFIICGVWCGVGAIRRSSSPRGTVG